MISVEKEAVKQKRESQNLDALYNFLDRVDFARDACAQEIKDKVSFILSEKSDSLSKLIIGEVYGKKANLQLQLNKLIIPPCTRIALSYFEGMFEAGSNMAEHVAREILVEKSLDWFKGLIGDKGKKESRRLKIDLRTENRSILTANWNSTVERYVVDAKKYASSLLYNGIDRKSVGASIKSNIKSGRESSALINELASNAQSYLFKVADDTAQYAFSGLRSFGVSDKYRWITFFTKSCPDCISNHNRVMSYSEWRNQGLPRSGATVCRHHCHCVLVPENYPIEVERPIPRKTAKIKDEGVGEVVAPEPKPKPKPKPEPKPKPKPKPEPSSELDLERQIAQEFGMDFGPDLPPKRRNIYDTFREDNDYDEDGNLKKEERDRREKEYIEFFNGAEKEVRKEIDKIIGFELGYKQFNHLDIVLSDKWKSGSLESKLKGKKIHEIVKKYMKSHPSLKNVDTEYFVDFSKRNPKEGFLTLLSYLNSERNKYIDGLRYLKGYFDKKLYPDQKAVEDAEGFYSSKTKGIGLKEEIGRFVLPHEEMHFLDDLSASKKLTRLRDSISELTRLYFKDDQYLNIDENYNWKSHMSLRSDHPPVARDYQIETAFEVVTCAFERHFLGETEKRNNKNLFNEETYSKMEKILDSFKYHFVDISELRERAAREGKI